MEKIEDYDRKLIANLLKKLGIISELFNGEITIGFTEGGIKFIKKSETLK